MEKKSSEIFNKHLCEGLSKETAFKGVDDIVIITPHLFSITIFRQSTRHMALLRLTYISTPQMASFNAEKAWCKKCKVTGFL